MSERTSEIKGNGASSSLSQILSLQLKRVRRPNLNRNLNLITIIRRATRGTWGAKARERRMLKEWDRCWTRGIRQKVPDVSLKMRDGQRRSASANHRNQEGRTITNPAGASRSSLMREADRDYGRAATNISSSMTDMGFPKKKPYVI